MERSLTDSFPCWLCSWIPLCMENFSLEILLSIHCFYIAGDLYWCRSVVSTRSPTNKSHQRLYPKPGSTFKTIRLRLLLWRFFLSSFVANKQESNFQDLRRNASKMNRLIEITSDGLILQSDIKSRRISGWKTVVLKTTKMTDPWLSNSTLLMLS